MDDALLGGIILLLTGLLFFLVRAGIVSNVLILDLWPALLLIASLYLFYVYFRRGLKKED